MTTLATDTGHGLKLVLQKSLQRWITRSSMDEIMPNLFLGGSYAAEYIADYNPKGINFVLTIMHKDLDEQTRQKLQANGIQHLHKKKRDEPNENLLELFSELSAVIEEELQSGQKVLVHCAMGISRSATIVCAYIMQRHGLTRSDAKKMVRSKRNVANPNSGFYTQLRIWEECKYDIKAPISINGVKPYKKEYQDWLAAFMMTNLETSLQRERRISRREREHLPIDPELE